MSKKQTPIEYLNDFLSNDKYNLQELQIIKDIKKDSLLEFIREVDNIYFRDGIQNLIVYEMMFELLNSINPISPIDKNELMVEYTMSMENLDRSFIGKFEIDYIGHTLLSIKLGTTYFKLTRLNEKEKKIYDTFKKVSIGDINYNNYYKLE